MRCADNGEKAVGGVDPFVAGTGYAARTLKKIRNY